MVRVKLCFCACLFTVLTLVSGQIKRPFVAARAVPEDEMQSIIDECNRRISLNNSIAHHVRVPSDCSAFAICDHPDSGVKPAMKLCSEGLFFNDDMDVQACVYPIRANCPQGSDPCRGKPDGYTQDVVRTQPMQGAYYRCLGDRTVSGGWCDLGEQYFLPVQACRRIPDLRIPTTTQGPTTACPLAAVDSDSRMFMSGGSMQPCPDSLVFDAVQCACV